MKNGILLALALLLTSLTHAQELNLTVKVNTQQLQLVDPSVFVTLEQSIAEFLSQKWTNDVYNVDERIDCNFILTLTKETSATSFEVTLAVQSSRPIYGTDQSTPLLNTIDNNVAFDYEQYQPLQFSENRFENNITSVLAFYVNIVLGMDYDSFSPLGGRSTTRKRRKLSTTYLPACTAPTWGGRQPTAATVKAAATATGSSRTCFRPVCAPSGWGCTSTTARAWI